MKRFPTMPGAVIGYTKRGRPIRVIAGGALNVDSLPTDTEQFQSYLDELNDAEVTRLEPALVERFKTVRTTESLSDEERSQILTAVTDQIKATRNEAGKRQTLAAQRAATETAAAHKQALANLDAIVFGGDGNGNGDGTGDGDGSSTEDGDASAAVTKLVEVFASALEKAAERHALATVTASARGTGIDLNRHVRNLPLAAVGKNAPNPRVLPARTEPVLVASADIPGRAKNGLVDGVHDLVKLMGARARMLPVTRGTPNYVPVAYLKREFRYRLTLDSTPDEVSEVLTAATNVEALVAAGGWCAPSEISYDFFNIVAEDGMLDIASVGILNRGGFRFPQSITIADILADPDVLWSWTEAQDEGAVTNDDVKTCARVTCPDFDEVRAACDGLCVTAGNLTDFAYPEAVENYIRTVMAARAHRTNQIVIAQLVAASDAVSMTNLGEGAAASLLNAAELQAYDYRERFRMADGSILEMVLPRWALGAIRADLANRNGVALMDVTNGMVADWFNLRGIRVQFVADWQSGFAGSPIGAPDAEATAWPSTVDFLLYAPGTFVRGQALQLDLGVVRDSTLNATNDHTAAWMEDCYAVAMVGHESRIVTADICVGGVTGAAEISCIAAS